MLRSGDISIALAQLHAYPGLWSPGAPSTGKPLQLWTASLLQQWHVTHCGLMIHFVLCTEARPHRG